MEICFVDLMGLSEYDCDTPYTKPLGGTQSAICYYAEALAAKDHTVTVVAINTTAEHYSRGVVFKSIKDLGTKRTNYNVIIWCSGVDKAGKTSVGAKISGDLSICWIPHNINEPAVKDLPIMLYDYDYFAFVSEWQRNLYIDTYSIPIGKTMLMLNGNSPAFQQDFDAAEKLPHFIYTSQPDRGLHLLTEAWPRIVEKWPTAELHTYASRITYGLEEEPETLKLFDSLRALKNVHVHAPVSQTELADAARKAAFFAYPCSFYETGCIACTEACAAGCLPIVSDLGALGTYFSNCLHYDSSLLENFVERANVYMELYTNTREAFAAQSERVAARFQAERDYALLAEKFIKTVNTNLVKKQTSVETFKAAHITYGANKFREARLILANMDPLFESQDHAFSYWLWMGVCHYHEMRIHAALTAFQKAANVHTNLQLCVNMILVNEALGNTKEMIDWCERSLKYSFDMNVINKILGAVQKLSYFERCKWGRYLLSLWNNDIHDQHWMTLFLSHGNMITSDYTLVMKHEEGHALMTDLLAKGLAFAKLHKVDLSLPTMNRGNIEKLFSNLFLNMNYFDSSNPNFYNAVKYFQENMPDQKLSRVKKVFAPITAGRKLRIGFLSGDYVYHPVSYVLNGIVEHLDKSKFDIYLFSTSKRDDTNKLQLKMRRDATEFCDMKDNIEDVVETIESKDIDVLVEMCGHTTNGTTLINALRMKPARVVAQYFAFPNTYGLNTVDYKIGDAFVFPAGLERYYTEKFCKINGGMHTYKPILELEVKRVKNKHITFGCFNNPKKFRSDWIKAVCKILKAVDGSKLKMRYFNLDDPSIKAFYIKEFDKHGISKERLDIGLGETLLRYFESYADVDIVLDPWPYNGGTINIEALYCSRPYITVLGNSYVSRVGASLLQQVGYPELIAKNADDYVEKAIALAADADRLDTYIREIRPAVMKSTLCDNAAFTREFEKGLYWMLRQEKWLPKN